MAVARGQDYKFVVDCKDGHCDAIRARMKEMGFRVRKKHTICGDHYGIKHFATERKANATADQIYADSPSKIYQIAVLPEDWDWDAY